MSSGMFTQNWYASASEEALMGLTFAYNAAESVYLIEHKDRIKEEISRPPHLPGSVYAIKNGIVVLTNTLVLSHLKRYGYIEL